MKAYEQYQEYQKSHLGKAGENTGVEIKETAKLCDVSNIVEQEVSDEQRMNSGNSIAEFKDAEENETAGDKAEKGETLGTEITESVEIETDLAAEQASAIHMENRLSPEYSVLIEPGMRIAAKQEEQPGMPAGNSSEIITYQVEEYISAKLEIAPMSTAELAQKDTLISITVKLQQIIDAKAPTNYDQLVRKMLRSFDIGRSSAQTLEAAGKALKKAISRTNKQASVEFIWKKNQDPDVYRMYRLEQNSDDKRYPDEIYQQEIKNTVRVTLGNKGALNKDMLIKETIQTMGYGRSGAALVAIVEKGLKYGRKSEEIIQNAEELWELNAGKKQPIQAAHKSMGIGTLWQNMSGGESLRIGITPAAIYNHFRIQERVSTMLFGEFYVELGSEQVYTTKHCAEPGKERESMKPQILLYDLWGHRQYFVYGLLLSFFYVNTIAEGARYHVNLLFFCVTTRMNRLLCRWRGYLQIKATPVLSQMQVCKLQIRSTGGPK